MKTELERGRTRRILIRAETCPADGRMGDVSGNWNQLVKQKKKKKEEERKNEFKKFAYLSSMKKRMRRKKKNNR